MPAPCSVCFSAPAEVVSVNSGGVAEALCSPCSFWTADDLAAEVVALRDLDAIARSAR